MHETPSCKKANSVKLGEVCLLCAYSRGGVIKAGFFRHINTRYISHIWISSMLWYFLVKSKLSQVIVLESEEKKLEIHMYSHY